MDFGRLQYHQRFDELCKQLLFLIYPKLKTIDGRGGDEGTDSFIGSISKQNCIFQFKYFPKNLNSTHWKKIRESLYDASASTPNKWVLLVTSDFTRLDMMRLHYDLHLVKSSPYYAEGSEHLQKDLPNSITKPQKLEELVKRHNRDLDKFIAKKIIPTTKSVLKDVAPISYKADDILTEKKLIILPHVLLFLKRYWFGNIDFDFRYDEYNQLWVENYIVAKVPKIIKDKLIEDIISLKGNHSLLLGIAILKRRMDGLVAKNNTLCSYINKNIITQIEREQYKTLCRYCRD